MAAAARGARQREEHRHHHEHFDDHAARGIERDDGVKKSGQ
jgi:hypothetical protein